MFEQKIFDPVSGERRYFVSENDAEYIKAIVSEFKKTQLPAIQHQLGVGAE